MTPKMEEYLSFASQAATSVTRYWENWAAFLTTASRLYKYSFSDQLMIFAQRPEATACADYDVWNNRMNRYVRRGAKGIALIDENGNFPRLHYVFDVSDTGVRQNSRDPDLWQISDSLREPVMTMLEAEYGIRNENFGQQLADIVGKLVDNYWDNNCIDIVGIIDGSHLMHYDIVSLEQEFKSAAAISATYMLLERCGFEPEGWFDHADFRAVSSFSTPATVYALGAAVSDMSREVLRKIERTVKTTTRRRNIENAERSEAQHEQQPDLLDRGRLPVAEPDLQPADRTPDEVRTDAPDASEGTPPRAVQHDAPERDAVPAPSPISNSTASGKVLP